MLHWWCTSFPGQKFLQVHDVYGGVANFFWAKVVEANILCSRGILHAGKIHVTLSFVLKSKWRKVNYTITWMKEFYFPTGWKKYCDFSVLIFTRWKTLMNNLATYAAVIQNQNLSHYPDPKKVKVQLLLCKNAKLILIIIHGRRGFRGPWKKEQYLTPYPCFHIYALCHKTWILFLVSIWSNSPLKIWKLFYFNGNGDRIWFASLVPFLEFSCPASWCPFGLDNGNNLLPRAIAMPLYQCALLEVPWWLHLVVSIGPGSTGLQVI